MKPLHIFILLSIAALAGCAPLRWSGHPVSGLPLTTAGPNPNRQAQPEKEIPPFIPRLPATAEEYAKAASSYKNAAAKYREDAASHQALQRLYGDTNPEMAAHCEQVGRQLLELAVRCDEVGRLFEEKSVSLKTGTPASSGRLP